MLKSMLLAAVAVLSVSAFAAEKTYSLPTRIICPRVDQFGETPNETRLTTGFRKTEVTAAELTENLPKLVSGAQPQGYESWSESEFMTQSSVRFAYATCDDDGEIIFQTKDLANGSRSKVKTVGAVYNFSLRADSVTKLVECKAIY